MDVEKKLEETAASILYRAVTLDKESRYTESLQCYLEGSQILMDLMKVLTNGERKESIKQKIEKYIVRAEKLKKIIEENKKSDIHQEHITIEENSIGHSYNSLLGKYLDADVTSVRVEDPYIRSHTQFGNFLQFCELVVKKCKNLKKIEVLTGPESKNIQNQRQWFLSLQTDLQNNYNVEMKLQFSTTLHDRQILLSNGWIIKIGRGLDYFKSLEDQHVLGAFDRDFRPCRETKVDIFKNATNKSECNPNKYGFAEEKQITF